MGLLDWSDDLWKARVKDEQQHKRNKEAKANRILKATKTRRGKRKKHKRKIPQMTYRQYMGSAYWKKRKNDYFGKHGKKCAVCSQKAGVTLHHKVYDHKVYGKEPDDHLVPLCAHHHHEFHSLFSVKSNMVKDTDLYIAHMRQYTEFELQASQHRNIHST